MGNKKNTRPANTLETTKESIIKILNVKDKDKISKLDENSNKDVRPINELNKKWDMNDRIIDIFIKNIAENQNLRRKYALVLMIILSIELIALIAIFILKGCNVLHYSDSTFNLFITAGIAEVFVLVRIIVKYLFKDNLTNALNIILENNNPIKRYTKNNNHSKQIKNKNLKD